MRWTSYTFRRSFSGSTTTRSITSVTRLSFRQQGGAPSIQFSVTQTGYRADIDVDYRSSAKTKALFNGHLTAGNSDVRAGNNYDTHNRRWNDLPNWWQAILISMFGGDTNKADADTEVEADGPIVPPAMADWERAAEGQVFDAIHAYFQQWLVADDPMSILRSISVKAYPCVAEFRDGSRPDSKLALYRILQQMKRFDRQFGKINDLSEAIEAVDYPLPGGKPVSPSVREAVQSAVGSRRRRLGSGLPVAIPDEAGRGACATQQQDERDLCQRLAIQEGPCQRVPPVLLGQTG